MPRPPNSTITTTSDVHGHLSTEADDRALASIDRRLPAVVAVDEKGAEIVRLHRAEKQLPEFDVDDDDDLAA